MFLAEGRRLLHVFQFFYYQLQCFFRVSYSTYKTDNQTNLFWENKDFVTNQAGKPFPGNIFLSGIYLELLVWGNDQIFEEMVAVSP